DALVTTNKCSALVDGTRAQTMSSKGSGAFNRVRCLAVRLTNAIALAVRNIAVIRILVFILDFSFKVSPFGLNGFVFPSSKRKMRLELQRKCEPEKKTSSFRASISYEARHEGPPSCFYRPMECADCSQKGWRRLTDLT